MNEILNEQAWVEGSAIGVLMMNAWTVFLAGAWFKFRSGFYARELSIYAPRLDLHA